MRPRRFLVPLALAALLGGCAEMPTEMRSVPSGREGLVGRVWPPPPEVPRYRYAGELLGEENFGPAERTEPGTGARLLRWIVGLGDGLRREPQELTRPQSGAVDAAGRIYVSDAGRGAVFVFDAAEGKLHVWQAADRVSEMGTPVGIAPGRDGEILVADAGLGRVLRLGADGEPRGSFGAGTLGRPTGLARDPRTGEVYVVDTQAHDIKVFDDAGRLLRRIGRRGSAPGQFNGPTHLALADGRLYVADTLNARVQVLSPQGEPLQTIGRRGLYRGNLTRPKGVAVDGDGNVYVVESYFDHLLVFDPGGRFLLPIGGTGARIGQFYLPAGAWSDGRGRIFVADMFNGRVVMFDYLGGDQGA
jgi:DNA-binding beta-propeller fold protein YncE